MTPLLSSINDVLALNAPAHGQVGARRWRTHRLLEITHLDFCVFFTDHFQCICQGSPKKWAVPCCIVEDRDVLD